MVIAISHMNGIIEPDRVTHLLQMEHSNSIFLSIDLKGNGGSKSVTPSPGGLFDKLRESMKGFLDEVKLIVDLDCFKASSSAPSLFLATPFNSIHAHTNKGPTIQIQLPCYLNLLEFLR